MELRAESAERDRDVLQRQLDAVDHALGFPHQDGLGRVELIELTRAHANELLIALKLGYQKLLTYGACYPGDKELHKTLIPMWRKTIEDADKNRACAHGHTKRVVGCVSCCLVFDRA